MNNKIIINAQNFFFFTSIHLRRLFRKLLIMVAQSSAEISFYVLVNDVFKVSIELYLYLEAFAATLTKFVNC